MNDFLRSVSFIRGARRDINSLWAEFGRRAYMRKEYERLNDDCDKHFEIILKMIHVELLNLFGDNRPINVVEKKATKHESSMIWYSFSCFGFLVRIKYAEHIFFADQVEFDEDFATVAIDGEVETSSGDEFKIYHWRDASIHISNLESRSFISANVEYEIPEFSDDQGSSEVSIRSSTTGLKAGMELHHILQSIFKFAA